MPGIGSDSERDGTSKTLILPELNDSSRGWGPVEVPSYLKDIPYAPFSKAENFGKSADWTWTQDRHDYDRDKPYRNSRYSQGPDSYGASMASAFSYIHTNDDDASFLVVDRGATSSRKINKPATRGRGGANGFQQRLGRTSTHSRGGGSSNRAGNMAGGRGRGRYRRYDKQGQRPRESSVAIGADWQLVEEIEFTTLAKLSTSMSEPQDLEAHGSLQYLDKTFERVSTKFERPLMELERQFYNVTTRADPVMQRLASERDSTKPCIFATDNIISTLMCATRSVYSWDIVVLKEGNNIFLDKRDGGVFDFLSVNENALNPPPETAEKDNPNTASALALEATLINRNFGQQVLKDSEKYVLAKSDPFVEADADEQPASVIYRYREWSTPEGCSLLLRTSIGAVVATGTSTPVPPVLKPESSDYPLPETQFINIKALTEVDYGKNTVAPDWRTKLDNQRGAVLAYEMKNNANKMAKWVMESVLSGVDQMRIGFVTRANPKDNLHHTILGLASFKPREVATQMNLNVDNCWGILSLFAKLFSGPKVGNGKYVLMRDPVKNSLRLFKVPLQTFENEDEGEEGEPDATKQ